MIVYESGVETVKSNGVLYGNPDAVRKLGIMLMVDAAESSIDMIGDCSDEYSTKAEMEAAFLHLNEQALDMLEDHIADLRRNMESFLRNAKVQARVIRVDYNKHTGNMSDVHIDLSVE